MSLGCILLGKIPTGNVHSRDIATIDGTQFKAGRFKYYQIHKTGTRSRENIFHSLERKKPYNLVSRTEEGGKKLKQTNKKRTHDFLTTNFRLFLVLTLSNKAKAPTDFVISFLFLYQYNWVCYKLTQHCFVSALHFHLGNSVSWFLPFNMYQLYGCVIWVTWKKFSITYSQLVIRTTSVTDINLHV